MSLSSGKESAQHEVKRITSVLVTDLVPNRGAASAKPRPQSAPVSQAHLLELDRRLGSVKIGELSVSRVELHRMGAQLDGSSAGTDLPPLLQPDGALIDTIQFDPLKVEQHIKAQPSAEAPDATLMLFELASVRSPGTPPLFDTRPGSAPSSSMTQLDKLLNTLRAAEAKKNQPAASSMPKWVNKLKSKTMVTAGLGMQVYGIYSGLLGIRDGLQKGDATEVGVNAGEIAGEAASMLVERGLSQTGTMLVQNKEVLRQTLRNGDKVLKGFLATSQGVWLIRGASLMAAVLTLPFDIYLAIRALDAAVTTTGKQAMDHYVNAGFSLTSAGLSVAIGVAALAGFNSAGPVGLLACATLILGARIYGAVRQVDDIDDYIELSVGERWRSGWFAFTGQDLDASVLERYQVEHTRVSYAKALKEQAQKLLDGEMKSSVEAIVSGRFDVEMRPVKHWKFYWKDGEEPYQAINTPTVVDSDDVIYAANGLDKVPGVSVGEPGKNKGIYWQLGGGDDQVFGVRDKSNYFSFTTGKKNLTGGDENDAFIFQVDETLKTPTTDAMNALHGGAGTDTVSLQGQVPSLNTLTYIGHEIDLRDGISLLKAPDDTAPVRYATMTEIENVETVPGGSSRVLGSREANTITLNGSNDTATGREGDDVFRLMGYNSRVDGGQGKDRYFVALKGGEVEITEDGQELSIIELDCAMEAISHWQVQGTSLNVKILRGADGYDMPRQVSIIDAYQTVDTYRILRNDAVLFITQDGFTLKPDLPGKLESMHDHDISMVVLEHGVSPTAPVIFNGGVGVLPHASLENYFIPRGCNDPAFEIQERRDKTTTTLYLDYDSTELQDVRDVTSRDVGHFSYLTYSDMSLTLQLSDNTQLTLKHYSKNGAGAPTNVAGILMSSGVTLVHSIILVLRDGTSYRVLQPRTSYLDDHRQPGKRVVDGSHALRRRNGHYLFNRPMDEVIRLAAKPQKITVPERRHNNIYVLEGNASAYEIHPSPGATLRLLTTSEIESSAWTVYTDTLSKDLDYTDLRVGEGWILIDDVRLLVEQTPASGKPKESVYVVLASGNCYLIDLSEAKARLLSMDIRRPTLIPPILQEILAHQADDRLATTFLSVEGICLIDGTPGAIFYDTLEQRWVVDSDDTRQVLSSELTIATALGYHRKHTDNVF
ncbi:MULTISPECIES: calcium-binding protein [unclassified Pseudomonas]|uniref:calcium-binding protein n=1 Tax=unclassified Pseudomonas TaxID=196821 RepID=UPI0030DBABA2